MSASIYTSKTGLYSIRLGVDLIHEGISAAEVADILKYYKERWDDVTIDWPFNPTDIHVEEFSGKYLLKGK